MLAESLRGVVSQVLIPAASGLERIPAVEILVGCQPLSDIIREGRSASNRMGHGDGPKHRDAQHGQALRDLVAQRKIHKQDAYLYAEDKNVIA